MPTVIEGDYEWDIGKAVANVAKLGVSFFDAIFALEDHDAITVADDEHVDRAVTIGLSANGLLVVVSAERGDRIRIISARKATSHEERGYQANRA